MAAVGHAGDGARRAERGGEHLDSVTRVSELARHRAAEAQRQLVHAALQIAQWTGRGALEPLAQGVERVHHRPLLAHHQLGGGRRRRSAEVGDEISDREVRSEEHTSELQSLAYLVCRLLLEKKKKTNTHKA